jgi:hypothetical protein
LQQYAAASGIPVERAPLPPCVLGRTCRDRITLHHELLPEQELPTLIHELAHWIAHRPIGSSFHGTIFEYEAEAVEALVMSRIGGYERAGEEPDPMHMFREAPTDFLLAASVSRVHLASERICEALGLQERAA